MIQPTRQASRVLFPLLFVASMLSTSPVLATLFVRVSDEDLADQADVVAEVVVRDLAEARPGRMPANEYQVEILSLLRGTVAGSNLTLRVPGGRKAEGGPSLRIWGAPTFEMGDRALLFLTSMEDGTYRILHFHQGAFHVGQVQGRTLAVRDFRDTLEVDLPGREALAAERVRDLSQFKSWLADRYQGRDRAADYWIEDAGLNIAGDAFVLTTRNGRRIRWQDFDSNSNVFFDAHEVPQPGLASGGYAEFQVSIQAWNDDGGSNIRLRYGGVVSNSTGFKSFDNTNSIVFDNPDGADDGSFTRDFSCISGGTIAIGGPWFDDEDPSNSHLHQGQLHYTTLAGDIITNKGLSCFFGGGNSSAAEEVFAHELGHCLGLSHSQDTNALMYFAAHDDGRGAQITADDAAAVAVLYPAGGGGAPTAPSNLIAVLGSASINLSWNDNSGNETGFSIERKSTGSFGEIATVNSSTTAFADTTALTGIAYTYRVSAFNGSGASGYSNEAGATLPGEKAPTNLVATSQGSSQIKLTWTDNATSETSYEIEARLTELNLGYSAVLTVPANSTMTTLTNLIPDTPYSFRVRAKGGLGNSSYSNEAAASTALAPIGACVEGSSQTCLSGERFKVNVLWRDFVNVRGNGTVVQAPSADSGIFYFFSNDNWEMLIKVLNACGINQRFWVFAAATTNVEYTLVVTDTQTGRTTLFGNPLGVSSAAITSTNAFDTCGSGATGSPESNVAEIDAAFTELTEWTEKSTSAGEAVTATCTGTTRALCLNQDRFKVDVTWKDFVGATGEGIVVTQTINNQTTPFGSDDSGLFYFFTPDNWEMLVKVLNGCGINNKYWVFAAATTNVEYHLKVTDTANPGVSPRQYDNALGVSSPTFADVNAFSCTP